ncbi:Aste57867_16584 [Aphanomyces stellatus]|uniref:Aste57867_16584 protein n=1 Tax=Aphanomyces stellatus TaxID=120398 RepID=A0A485L6M8_9STRA|nr:hypothetical protein As57867_016527 [Aphanomyces stellatus]VFT93355.1 Aste57867_16584 [Aphanomyces stellatus]
MNDSVVVPRTGEQQQVNSFNDFQRNCYLLENALSDAMTDPRPSLTTLWTWIDWVNRGMGTPKHDTHLYTHCLPRVANGFLRRSFNLFPDHEIPQQILHFLREFVRLLALRLQPGSDHYPAHLDTIHNILNPNHLFYQCHGHAATSVAEVDADSSLSFELPVDLSVGVIVDAYRSIHRTWYEGVILNRNTNQVYVAFYGLDRDGDGWIDVDSNQLAPRGTKANGRRGHGPIRIDLDESIPDVSDAGMATYPFAVVRPRVPCSRFVIDLIDTFGQVGGFQKLPLRLTTGVSMSLLTTTISLISNVFPWLTRFWAEELGRQSAVWMQNYLSDVVRTRDELRSVTKPMLDTLHVAYKSMCRRLGTREEASAHADAILLQLCLQCIHSSVLEIRLHGLKCLTDFIPMIRQAQMYPFGVKFVGSSVSHAATSSSASSTMIIHVPITEATTKRQFASWCDQHKLLQVLCDSHEQVIRRTPELVRFLCDADAFDLASLDIVWQAILSNGPDMRASLFFLLESIASYMTVPVCHALLELVASYGLVHVNVLALVGAMAKYAPLTPSDDDDDDDVPDARFFATPNLFQVRAACRYTAMSMLWTAMQDTTDEAKRALFDTAKQQLQESIKANVEDEWTAVVVGCVSYLLELALHSLRTHSNVTQAFGVVGYLLQLFDAEKTQIVTVLEQQGLLQIILDDLLVFKNTYAPFHGQLYTMDQPDSVVLPRLNALLLAHGSHADFVDHLKARLGFLSLWLTIQPSLHWSFGQLELMWTTLNAKATLTSERTMFFKWLTTNALHLHPSNVAFVFEQLMGANAFLHSAALGPLSLQCFLCFFRLVNHHRTLLTLDTVTTVNSQNLFTIHKLPLVGMTTLWTILLHGTHPVVFSQTMKFLVLLPFKLEPTLELDFLRDGLHYLGTLTDPAPLRRCLVVLSSIIGTDEGSATALATGQWVPHGKASRGAPLQLTVNNTIKMTSTSGQKLALQVYANDTVLEMQVAVARRIDAQPLSTKGLRFFRMGTEIHEMSRCLTLAEAGFKDGDTVLVVYRPNVPLVPLAARPPVVFEPQLVSVLMQLIRDHDTQEAWELLMRLPTPSNIVQDIRTHADAWTTLFSKQGSVTQLLYRLQVLDNLIGTDTDMLTTFVTTDGPACIVELLLADGGDVASDESPFVAYLRKECTMVCLRLLVTFLAHSTSYQDCPVPKMVDFDPEHLNIDMHLVLELVLSPYKELLATSAATVQPNSTIQAHVETLIHSINYPALHAACCRLLVEALHERAISTVEYGLRVYLVCSQYSALFQTLPPAILSAITASHRQIRHLVSHAMLVLCLDASYDLVPVRCGALAHQLLALEVVQPPLHYYTLLGLFLLTAKSHPSPQTILDAQLRQLQAFQPPPGTFLADSSSHLFGEQYQPLLGILFVIRCLLAGFPALQTFQPTLLMDVWHECLMSYPTDDHNPTTPVANERPWLPRCTTATSRQGAFRLLVDLTQYPEPHVADNGNLAFVMQQVPRVVQNLKRFHDDWEWQWDPHLQMKASYVGLRNLGCTCYMNSTLQQLFMVPQIRAAVLAMDVGDSDPSVFRQTQRLFAYLQESQLKSMDPQQLIACLSDESGAPLNVMIQQDAEEFLTKFADGLSEFLKKAHTPTTLFDGTVCTQLVCQGGCNTIRETAATSFVCMTVEVKGHDSLGQSLKVWSEGEMLSGVNCDACGSKQDTMKRDCMDALPTTLLLHLKRFELNFDTFMREKVNDEFSFPLTLDMFPYTKAGVQGGERGEAIYHLVGCVVHMGSTESGHYYSLIQDRASGHWMEFNDEHVSPFDVRQLEAECFGGVQSDSGLPNTKSAYLLVYERKPAAAIDAAASLVPRAIAHDIDLENHAFVQACYAHEQEFLTFVCTLLDQLPVTKALHVDLPQWPFLVAAVQCIPIYARAFTTAPLPLLSLLIKHVECPTFAAFVLGQHVQDVARTMDALLHCTKAAVRAEFGAFLLHLSGLVVDADRARLDADAQLVDTSSASSSSSQSLIGRLVDVLLMFAMMDDVVTHWRHMHELMLYLDGLAKLDPTVQQLLRARKCGMYLLDLFLGDLSPLMGKQYMAYSRKRLPKTPPSALVLPLQTVTRLYADQPHATVDPDTRSCLLLRTLYVKMFAHLDHAKALGPLLVQWSWEWEAYTMSVVSVVGEVVATLNTFSTTVAGLVYVLDSFLGLRDSLHETRIASWFDAMWKSVEPLKSAQAQGQCVGVLLLLGTRHPVVHECMLANIETWGPYAGSVIGIMAKQPWTLHVDLADKSEVEWTHTRSLERMTELLLESGRSLEWLEVHDDGTETFEDADSTAYLWDATID